MMVRFLVTASLALSTLTAFADDAYWMSVGSAGSFATSKDIQMESEDVRISLHNTFMHVRASFRFKNSGPTQTVTMAFPETVTDYKKRTKNQPLAIRSFKSWVDGQLVPVVRKRMPLKNLDEYAQYSAVWLKKVSFKAGGRRHVVCEYDSNYSTGTDYRAAYYILRSGATWRGTIGECKITVDWSHLHHRGEPTISAAESPIGTSEPLAPVRKGNKRAVYYFKNLEPKFDLEMMWPECFWNFRISGKEPEGWPVDVAQEAMVKGSPYDPLIQPNVIVPLLGDEQEFKRWDEESLEGPPIIALGREFEFPDDHHVTIDGKSYPLSRPLQGKRAWKRSRWLHLRDLITALGGSYRYDPKLDRADITLRQ
jgi:hypothetical protein